MLLDPELPTVKLKLDHDARDNLWGKTKLAFQYVGENYRYSLEFRKNKNQRKNYVLYRSWNVIPVLPNL